MRERGVREHGEEKSPVGVSKKWDSQERAPCAASRESWRSEELELRACIDMQHIDAYHMLQSTTSPRDYE